MGFFGNHSRFGAAARLCVTLAAVLFCGLAATAEAQQVGASYRISHPWLPFGLNSVIEATFPRRSETVRGSVRSQTIPLGQPGALVSTTFSVTEG